ASARSDPSPSVARFVAAMNRSDAAGALAAFGDGAAYHGVLVCEPEPCVGAAAIGAALELEVADGTSYRLWWPTARDDGDGFVVRGEARSASLGATADRVVVDVAARGDERALASLRMTPDP